MQTLFLTGEWAMGTFWAFVPAIVAICLALITKQVYLSLFAGIFFGAMFLANGNPINAIGTIFEVMAAKIDVGILAFLIVLGIIVILLQKSGGSKAYGDWASEKIKTKGGALAATSALGCLIMAQALNIQMNILFVVVTHLAQERDSFSTEMQKSFI